MSNLDIAANIVTIVALFLGVSTYLLQSRYNKRMKSFEFMMGISLHHNGIREGVRFLKKEITSKQLKECLECVPNSKTDCHLIDEIAKDEHLQPLIVFLNQMDFISLGVEKKVLDIRIIEQVYRNYLHYVWDNSKDYIVCSRKCGLQPPDSYVEFEKLISKLQPPS